jgi:inorganic triphosphatase YgiF
VATELEVKLTLLEAAQSRAFEWLKGRPGASEGPVKTLVNRYYDTPNAGLNLARAALRVRQAGERFIQTLKTRGEFVDGAHRREEWEWELSGPDLDLSLLEQTPLHGQVDLTALELAFETNFQRQVVMLESGTSTIEVAVDSGEILGGGLSLPLHEVEFELKAGEPGELMRWAKALACEVPVFLNLVSKAEQGYFLAGIYRPNISVPGAPLSTAQLLHTLSVSWLTGEPVKLSETVLGSVSKAASASGFQRAWQDLSIQLQSGATAADLIQTFPDLGRLQLALALGG